VFSVAIPAYNEEQTLPALIAALRNVLDPMDIDYELLFVNDGSTDRTPAILQEYAERDPRIKVLSFSRNFGHQAAVTAALDFAEGDAVVIMDADMQDPPELLPQMFDLFRQGYDVVSPQRIARDGDSLLKRLAIRSFYWIMRKMVDKRLVSEVGDFRLYSRAAVLAIRNFREQHRFIRGLVAWLGLKEAIVPLHRQARIAGKSKYSWWKLWRLAWAGIASFSALPLRLSLAAGSLCTTVSLIGFLYAAYLRISLHKPPALWAMVLLLQCFFAGLILLAIGFVGDYLARIYEETKDRPLYVIGSYENLEAEHVAVTGAMVLARRKAARANAVASTRGR